MTIHLSNVVAGQLQSAGDAWTTRSFQKRDFSRGLSPVVSVDHFVMTATATAAPQPKQPDADPGGFVATLLLEDSRGGLTSLGANGVDHEVQAGDLHWARADAGIMRLRQPASGARLNGLRIVLAGPPASAAGPGAPQLMPDAARAGMAALDASVIAPGAAADIRAIEGRISAPDASIVLAATDIEGLTTAPDTRIAPANIDIGAPDTATDTAHDALAATAPDPLACTLLRGWQMPVLQTDAGRVRLAAGSHGGWESSLATPEPMMILDGWLRPGATWLVPLAAGWSAWIYAVSGSLGLRARHCRHDPPKLPRQATADLDFAVLNAGSALTASAQVGERDGVLVLMAGLTPAHFVLIAKDGGRSASLAATPAAPRRRGGARPLTV
ncbi:pirin family protein [Achromobacter piechaudii]|uniref:pirin family protein n=1 Tax=Achromobacter piechaudii TaxID=72556 RepID=UPI0012F493F5|nr:pirin family protein [Achromobacter piechaudii]